MLKKIIISSVLASMFLLIGCGETPANISGEAFLTTQGGFVKTCAGNPVYLEKFDINGLVYLTDLLEPKKNLLKNYQSKIDAKKELANPYNPLHKHIGARTEIGWSIVAIEADAIRAKGKIPPIKKEIEDIEKKIKTSLSDAVKETTCDSQGKFIFSELKADTYYVSTRVKWDVRGKKQGGIVSKTITIKEGDNKVIIAK